MFVVDTNLLLYAVNPDAREHEEARDLLEGWRRDARPWFVTWGITYEFLRVSTHRSVFRDPLELSVAREWLALAIRTPSAGVLVETERHEEVLQETVGMHPRLRGNAMHDLHTAVLMKEHGISEIRTADTDFHQFSFLRVVNPFKGR